MLNTADFPILILPVYPVIEFHTTRRLLSTLHFMRIHSLFFRKLRKFHKSRQYKNFKCIKIAKIAKKMTPDDENETKNDTPSSTSFVTAVGSVELIEATSSQQTDDNAGESDCHEPKQPVPLSQKLAQLHEKTKTLRNRLGLGRRDLQLRQQEVQQCAQTRETNDEQAAHAMSTVEVDTNCDMMSSYPNPSAKTAKRKVVGQKRPKRKELEQQVECLQELLLQLTKRDPVLQSRVQQLVQENPKLRNVQLHPAIYGHGTTSTAPQAQQQPQPLVARSVHKLRYNSEPCTVPSTGQLPRQTAGGVKQRHTSEVSTTSSSASQRDADTTTESSNAKKTNKRNARRKKNNSSQVVKSQASEEEALAKYINAIVNEYLGERKERAAELEFKGGVDELESYAQRLVQAGLGRVVEEEIRINRKNNRQAFITMSNDRDGSERDGIVTLPVARRYAFEGDIVRAFVMNAANAVASNEVAAPVEAEPEAETAPGAEAAAESGITGGKEHSFCIADDEDPFTNEDSDLDPNELDTSAVIVSDNCPKSFVIAIVKQTVLRQVVGTISFKNANKLNDERLYYKLKPHDMRVPMVYIPEDACGAYITEDNKKDVCGFLYLAQVRETDPNGHCIGELVQPVGKVGNLEAEMKAILLHNGLKDIQPYEERFNELYAQPDPPISEADLRQREDLRKACVFTIDPLTARDLDDAMSVERLSDDLYEVGVHISDVSYYLQENSELDNIVKERATSIYLVNAVIHMLPQPLCFKCSLLPGEDKFAFSVFWHINLQGVLQGSPRFTRTIINSCSQFAYEHAQKIIDNPSEQFGVDDLPTICNNFTPGDIEWRVRTLHTIADQLRKRRYDDGALSINNPKLRFGLDPQTGEPTSYDVDGRQEANFLIEEFMLLANQSVARFIYERFPDTAILRNHAPPLAKSMKSLREKLGSLGIEFDFSSSKTVYESMQRICRAAPDPQAMDACLSTLLTKPMARAKYYCSEGKTEESDLWHYALSIPIYTHFTSPIRRYPDILVHRLLASALNYCPPPKRSPDELHLMAKVCNDQKFNAKNAGDESINLFFKRYIKAKQSITLRAVVMEIHQHVANVVTIETGHVIAINYKIQKVLVDTTGVPARLLLSEKNSKQAPLVLQMFSTIDVKLVIWDDKICGFFISPDPKQRQLNCIESSKKKQQQQQQPPQRQQAAQKMNGASGSKYAQNGPQQQTKSKAKQPAKPNQERVYAVRSNASAENSIDWHCNVALRGHK